MRHGAVLPDDQARQASARLRQFAVQPGHATDQREAQQDELSGRATPQVDEMLQHDARDVFDGQPGFGKQGGEGDPIKRHDFHRTL